MVLSSVCVQFPRVTARAAGGKDGAAGYMCLGGSP